MKHCNHIMTFMLTITASFMAVGAEEVYKSKGKQGSVEFSDQPSPGAKVVDLDKPNIVELESGKPAETAPATETKIPADSQSELGHQNRVYYDDDPKQGRLGELRPEQLPERPQQLPERPEQLPERSGEDKDHSGQEANRKKEVNRQGGRR